MRVENFDFLVCRSLATLGLTLPPQLHSLVLHDMVSRGAPPAAAQGTTAARPGAPAAAPYSPQHFVGMMWCFAKVKSHLDGKALAGLLAACPAQLSEGTAAPGLYCTLIWSLGTIASRGSQEAGQQLRLTWGGVLDTAAGVLASSIDGGTLADGFSAKQLMELLTGYHRLAVVAPPPQVMQAVASRSEKLLPTMTVGEKKELQELMRAIGVEVPSELQRALAAAAIASSSAASIGGPRSVADGGGATKL